MRARLKTAAGSAPGTAPPCPTLFGMRGRILLIGLLNVTLGSIQAQWALEESTTTADLRAVDSVGGGVAWASGTNGTVVRTEDGGYEWQPCSVPPGAEYLDFRGIQAFDANTAIVMSSGKGELSRLFKTTDGCQTWKLIFTNPDKDGFWDAVEFQGKEGFILGDPVDGRFVLFFTPDWGSQWGRVKSGDLEAANAKIGAFAASNSALTLGYEGRPLFGTSGPDGPWLYVPDSACTSSTAKEDARTCFDGSLRFEKVKLPLAGSSPSAGIFSLGVGPDQADVVAVGGDYQIPDRAAGTAATAEPWTREPKITDAAHPPHGYRSSVVFSAATKTWITVGPNGTDVSSDDGHNWRAVHPHAELHETPDADRNWNAISLPFVVGPHGRIGKLDPPALAP
jgi:Photosynthesis system II assembly factor YCF48